MEGCNWYWPQTRTLLVLSGCKLSLETLTFERTTTSTITIFQNRHRGKLRFILFFTREIKESYLFWRPLSPLQSGNRISNIRWVVTATSKFSLKSLVEWLRLSRFLPQIMLVHNLLSNLPQATTKNATMWWSPVGGGRLPDSNRRRSFRSRGPDTSTLWKRIDCTQFQSYDMCSSISSPKILWVACYKRLKTVEN